MKKKSFLQGALCGALAMLLAAGLIFCGGKLNNDRRKNPAEAVEQKLGELESLIDESYIHKVDEEELTEGIYKGYIAGLQDPYSAYYDKEETKEMYETSSGEFEGIGVLMSQDRETGAITMVQVYEDSPAMKAGFQDNDILYKVEGEEVTGKDLSEVVSKIKGEKGTKVELTVLRGETAEEITAVVTRDKVEAQTVDYRMMADQIGYIAISEFDTVTYEQYKKALEDLEAQGMKGLVVDLRNNPGGNLMTVCDMLDLMLPEGPIVFTEDKGGHKEQIDSDEEHKFEKPMAVLTNGNSASASEIYAGAIQDYGIGEIVGTTTYGKGVVQQVFDLKDGTSLKLTVAEYFTAKERSIDGKGIVPDVEVEYEANLEDPTADNQLNRAAEVVKEKITK